MSGKRIFAPFYRSVAVVAVMVLMAACSLKSGTVFNVPIAEARRILVATGLPPEVFGTETPPWEVRDGGSEVTWIVLQENVEVFRYIAHLKEEDQGSTRVHVELVGVQSGPAGNVEQRLSEHSEIRDMYLVAINEQIASALERRPYEISRVYPAMMTATLSNIGLLKSSADEAAAASERLARENIKKAYRDEAAGIR
jgi:hypothetical protein